jgi:(1->4)-alpha-D-glucan 1-alpha-D-glucosylmutase
MMAINTDELFQLTLERARALARRPVSTYRLQFHAGFTFTQAGEIVPYLADLGITHIYASPYLAAVAGSMHGYDVIDHTRLNPEIGSEQDYEEFLAALDRRGMSHILDVVPNHMGVETNDNAWWNSVLELGRDSPFAGYFDIAWDDPCNPASSGRVLIPALGEPYGDVLEKGQLKLELDRSAGRFFIGYFNRRFPIAPASTNEILPEENRLCDATLADGVAALNGTPGDSRSFDRLDSLLLRQHYRLAWWRIASQEINYRRFFDINGLAALAMENEEVFVAVHEFTLHLAAEGKITGLRVDHPDGLYDPEQYFRRLQKHFLLAIAKQIARERLDEAALKWAGLEAAIERRIDVTVSNDVPGAFLYVVVEKILAFGESLPTGWHCDGSSGYDFLVMTNALFVDRAHEEKFTQIYQRITGNLDTFGDIAYRKKLLVLKQSFASETRRLTELLLKLAAKTRTGRDFSFENLQDGLRELIASFGVYRTYINSPVVGETDQSQIQAATEAAIRRNPHLPPGLFHFIRDMLLQKDDHAFVEKERDDQLRFAGQFQQLSSPATAKGVEDTAFYVYQRLISLNEVGGDPGRFGIDPDELHQYFLVRQQRWPHALSALSTHDTKRSEDVRARLNVLSEIPDDWEMRVTRWIALNAKHRRSVNDSAAPAPDEEYLLYQTLLGVWPLASAPGDLAKLEPRIWQFMQKALREAKLRTSWMQPQEQWEEAMRSFIGDLLSPAKSAAFLEDISAFARQIARRGLLNSLSQTLIRLAAPGVPDTYQGTELWDFSLVDPDNRRPVDYPLRRRLLDELKTIEALPPARRQAEVGRLFQHMEDGRIKLWTIRQGLRCRKLRPDLLAVGQYVPVTLGDSRAASIFAFARFHENHCALCVVPRFAAVFFSSDQRVYPGGGAWGDTQLKLPESFRNASLENVLTGERIVCGASDRAIGLALSEIFSTLPIALFVGEIQSSN